MLHRARAAGALKASRAYEGGEGGRDGVRPGIARGQEGYFQCCFIYCTCHTYHVVPTVGQGLIFQTGSTDMSAPIRLLRECRESHARFVALVSVLVDTARWYHEILVRFAYIDISPFDKMFSISFIKTSCRLDVAFAKSSFMY